MENAKYNNEKGFDQLVADVWKNHSVMLDIDKMSNRFADDKRLESEGIIVNRGGRFIEFTNVNNVVSKVDDAHRYHMPAFTDEVKALMTNALDGGRGGNILLTGSMGTGKTEFVYEISKQMGFSKVYQVNGSDGLTVADFLGQMGVEIDEASGQNKTVFEKGPLYRAFIEGTEVDADGNQVLYDENGNVSENGNPKVIGKPAVFFLDEFAAMLPEVFLGVFNRVLEIPRNGGSRSMEVVGDGGRTVKSHPGMMLFLAGNTVGTGNTGKYQMGYTAQSNKMDESTLNRITASFHFGYDKGAESEIASRMLNDDLERLRVLNLRDEIRRAYRDEKVERLFTTRTIVQICSVAVTYRNMGIDNWMTTAIKRTVFDNLPEQDKQYWNESIRMIWGRDYVSEESKDTMNYDYL